MQRDYESIVRQVRGRVTAAMDTTQRMQVLADAIWESLGGDAGGVSWVGFYLAGTDGREMVLGPCRDKPACSPIGLHGVCGQAMTGRKAMLVADVRDLGQAYIACDPLDRSEVVVPLPDAGGRCRAVLDLDSHRVSAFDEGDVRGLRQVLVAALLL